MRNRKLISSLLLFLAACIWGMAFVSQSKGMEYMGPFTFNGVRCMIGFLTLLVFCTVTGRTGKLIKGQLPVKNSVLGGVFCGIALAAASSLQQVGILYTTVGKAGFITTLYIIFVPIGGIFFRKKVPLVVWAAAGIAAVGMYLLCMQESLVLSTGDTLVFLCAIVFAIHIMTVEHFSPNADGVVMSCVQFGVCGLICISIALVFEAPNMSAIQSGIIALLYAGVLSCGVAYTLQIVGQKNLNATVAALIMSLESVVACVSGYAAYKIGILPTDQTLTVRQIFGCVIVFAAVILVQLPTEWFQKRKK